MTGFLGAVRRLLVFGLKLALSAGLGLFALYVGFAALDARHPFPFDKLGFEPGLVVTDARGETLRVFLPHDGRRRIWKPLDHFAPEFVQTILESEDRRFFTHPGVNPAAILAAAWTNLTAGRVVRGGSTITMQLARLAEPRPRTLQNKCLEAFRALQLEARFSKREILERYLNLTPYGGNLVGAEAAAQTWFGKGADRLSQGEAALLAVLPRSPNRYDPLKHPLEARKRRDGLVDLLHKRGLLDGSAVQSAKAHSLPDRTFPPPFIAPHFTDLVRAGAGGAVVKNKPREIKTTLDAKLQRVLQAVLARYVERLREQGVENAGLVVLEARSGRVKAWVGSAEYTDEKRHGFIDAVTIRRSPGSTLKPFVYGLAIDGGKIVPKSILLDIPKDFSGWSPLNYDGLYRGRVEAAEALAQSLNAPAARLTADVGVERFHELLKAGGIRLGKPAAHYGLALSLGACETSLLELAQLYTALADSGVAKKPVLRDGEAGLGVRVLSPEAAKLTRDMLTLAQRPDLPDAWEIARDAPAAAFKTGTSFGHRDAWALAATPNLVVGVWVGNLDGKPVNGISGGKFAAPLLFEAIRAAETPGADFVDPPHLNLAEAEVCAASRLAKTPHCPESTTITVIPGVTKLAEDELHTPIFIDADSGLRVEGDCLAGRRIERRVVRIEPPEVAAWLASIGDPAPAPPPFDPACGRIPAHGAPKITSPNPKPPYTLRRDAPVEFQKIALRAQTGPEVSTLTWFQDGALLGTSTPAKPLFLELVPGRRRVVVLDDQGRLDAVEFTVLPPAGDEEED